MIQYFNKFGNCLNGVWSIFALCSILVRLQIFHEYIFKSFNINLKTSFFIYNLIPWVLNYFIPSTICKKTLSILKFRWSSNT